MESKNSLGKRDVESKNYMKSIQMTDTSTQQSHIYIYQNLHTPQAEQRRDEIELDPVPNMDIQQPPNEYQSLELNQIHNDPINQDLSQRKAECDNIFE